MGTKYTLRLKMTDSQGAISAQWYVRRDKVADPLWSLAEGLEDSYLGSCDFKPEKPIKKFPVKVVRAAAMAYMRPVDVITQVEDPKPGVFIRRTGVHAGARLDLAGSLWLYVDLTHREFDMANRGGVFWPHVMHDEAT
jgi:hypothetical protein